MDPFAHTLTGAALAASGLRRATPLATAALLIGVNAPDIDILASYGGEYMAQANRRGWTHGILAWIVLPLLLTGLLAGWDRWVRRRCRPDAVPANLYLLLALTTLAVLTHPALDWLNNYGIRLLMPFDGRWFYGDALFIIDPWVWLVLGGACFITWSRHWLTILMWLLLWGGASWLVVGNTLTPDAARYVWIAGLTGIFGWRMFQPSLPSAARLAQFSLVLVLVYTGANAAASRIAEARVADYMNSSGNVAVETVMVGPTPANPFQGNVVVVTDTHYLIGEWNWLAAESFTLTGDPIERNLDEPVINAAASHIYASRYLVWSRFPYGVVEQMPGGEFRVRFFDARYAGLNRGIGGPVIMLDRELKLLSGD